MNTWCLPVAAGFGCLAAALWAFEARRTRGKGGDPIVVFVFLAALQTCVAGVGIFTTLAFVDPGAATGTEAFDRIFFAADSRIAWLVLCLTVWFFVFFYVGCAIGRLVPRSVFGGWGAGDELVVQVRLSRLVAVVMFGAAVSGVLFLLLGHDFVGRYANLILLRTQSPQVTRTAFSANAFALTQTWSWLSVLAVLVVWERRGRGALWAVCILMTVVLALLGVSRRAIFLPILLGYIALVMQKGRWRAGWIVAAALPLVLLMAFGKSLFASLAFSGSFRGMASAYQSWANAFLKASSDVGVTVVESLGTLSFLHVGPRLGVDHLLSIARRVPEGMLGFRIDFPERIVRISTAAFAGDAAADIPPGLMGQMWLDAGPVGPVFWGLLLGLQVGVLQACFERTRRSLQSCAVFAVLVFVVAVPVRSGSFDFTFSVDMFALLLLLMWCVRIRRTSALVAPGLS